MVHASQRATVTRTLIICLNTAPTAALPEQHVHIRAFTLKCDSYLGPEALVKFFFTTKAWLLVIIGLI